MCRKCIPNRIIFILGHTEKCTWVIEDGWYAGTYIGGILTEYSKHACAKKCCENPQCGTWTWRSVDNMCILKKNDNLHLESSEGHFTSKRNQGHVGILWKIFCLVNF